MLWTDVARAAVIVVLPVLALSGELAVADIYAVAFVQSSLGILFNCGEFAAIPSLVGQDDLVAANGRIMATNSAGQIVGPILAGVLVTFMSPASLLFFDAASFLVSAACLAAIRRSFNSEPPPARRGAGGTGLLEDVREGLRFVWSHPVLRSISIMMALINFVATTQSTQLVLFAKQTLGASDTQVALLFAAGAAGIVIVAAAAAPIGRRLSFAVTVMALLGSYPAALVLWAASSGFGLLLNINTGALRQAIVPSRLYGRVISVASVLAWSAIPLGALAGAAAIRLTGSVADVYAATGILIALIALSFAFSPVRHGDRYLAEAAAAGAPGAAAAEAVPATE